MYLERLKDVALVLELPLATPLKLDFHWSRASCLQDPHRVRARVRVSP